MYQVDDWASGETINTQLVRTGPLRFSPVAFEISLTKTAHAGQNNMNGQFDHFCRNISDMQCACMLYERT